MKEESNNPWTKLEGKYFHSFNKDGRVKRQGQIIATNAALGFAVVTCFDWVVGSERETFLVWFKEIVDEKWGLYLSSEEMKIAYEVNGGKR